VIWRKLGTRCQHRIGLSVFQSTDNFPVSPIPLSIHGLGRGAPPDRTLVTFFRGETRRTTCHRRRLRRRRTSPLGSGLHRPARAPTPLARPPTFQLSPCGVSSCTPAPLGFPLSPSGNGRRPSLEGRDCRALRGAPATLER